ncbi:response regulator transcription factor [Streptomyces brasiliensis]|uniref:HTH luxR-type domain-containing protein n=1 Tax=Streptomyces brasiliensis TaxID=1954 RepID=A0A917P1P8_9ACTN|nr:response regulator transcription factor [Streptomyces brasiliensis]GGJ51577.1 hypothetical protein GCM10010121_073100 [Streptomyces brasiliensis]
MDERRHAVVRVLPAALDPSPATDRAPATDPSSATDRASAADHPPPAPLPSPLARPAEHPAPAPVPAAETARSVRVHVVGADPLVRVGIRTLLEGHPGISVIGESAPGPQLGVALRSVRPHVVVAHGTLSTAQHTRLTQDAPDGLPVLVVGGGDDVPGPVHGHLPGTTTPRELAAAVVLAAAGYTLVPAEGRRAQPRARVSSIGPEELTRRECEVLELLARGLSNSEIARCLTLSEHTVKTHVQNMLHKLRLPNRVHAAIYAFETGVRRPL